MLFGPVSHLSVNTVSNPGTVAPSPQDGSGLPSLSLPLLRYTRASLVAQLVKNPPAMRETWVPSLSWEEPLEKGKATHSGLGEFHGIPWTA